MVHACDASSVYVSAHTSKYANQRGRQVVGAEGKSWQFVHIPSDFGSQKTTCNTTIKLNYFLEKFNQFQNPKKLTFRPAALVARGAPAQSTQNWSSRCRRLPSQQAQKVVGRTYESSKCVTMTSSMKSAHVSIHCWIVEGVQTSRGEHMMEHLMSHSAPISETPQKWIGRPFVHISLHHVLRHTVTHVWTYVSVKM